MGYGSAAEPGVVRRPWPLVGRDDVLAELGAALSASPAGAIIAGPAGVGKTRLAAEVMALDEARHLTPIRLITTPAIQRSPLAVLTPIVADLRPEPPDDPVELGAVLRGCFTALRRRFADGRSVLLVDDAQYLDDPSATVLLQLVSTGTCPVVAVVGTASPPPTAVRALWKDGLLPRVELQPLPPGAVDTLLQLVLGGPVDAATVGEFSRRAAGDLRFLVELVHGALEDGSLREEVGIWHLVSPAPITPRLVELVEDCWSDLSGPELEVLELSAFAGSLHHSELLQLADPALATGLERRGLLQTRRHRDSLEVGLAHPLHADVLRMRIPAMALPGLAQSLVAAAGEEGDEDKLRVAVWRLDAGGAPPEVLFEAAEIARWRYEFALAERLARAAVSAGAGFEARLLAAQAVILQGRGAEGEAELARLSEEAVTDDDHARVSIARMDQEGFYGGRIDDAFRIAEQAESRISDASWLDEITARRAGLLMAAHGPRIFAEKVSPLLDRLTGRALAWACHLTSYSLSRLGRLREALEVADQGLNARVDTNGRSDWYPCYHVFDRCEALAQLGDVHTAQATAEEEYRRAIAERSLEAQALMAFQLSRTVGERGYPRSAARHGREAVALMRQLGRPQFEQYDLQYLALALALGGKAVAAREVLATLDALGLGPIRQMGVDLLVARAWTAVAGGDLGAARAFLREAASTGYQVGDLVGVASALHGVARLGEPAPVLEELAALSGRLEGALLSARTHHVEMLASGDAGGLEAACDRFEEMGADLLAAEAAADAAVVWRRRGDPRRAARTEVRGRTIAARCEDPVTPALGALRARSELTPAERGVAYLAASGRTNREIADELHLSVRTIESHLHHVYAKLGVTDRAHLADGLTVDSAALSVSVSRAPARSGSQ